MDTMTYASTPQDAVTLRAGSRGSEFKAGGTDVVDRVRRRAAPPPVVVNLSWLEGLRTVEVRRDVVKLGALVTLRELGLLPAIHDNLPALWHANDHTATPQVRALATVGGALCQRPRCPYFRHPEFTCRKRGGEECHAREGDHHAHAIFDNRVCCAPHPSTLGAALLALDATLQVRQPSGTTTVTMGEFFDVNMGDAAVENALEGAFLVESVTVALPVKRTRQGYLRASPRHLADWPEVEVVVVLEFAGDVVGKPRVVLGGVGRVPLRAMASEEALVGKALSPAVIAAAAAAAAQDATPLEGNAHKVLLTRNAVRAALEEISP
jgi:xanthine dehydrogenase YagS FAD-binding subunit